MNAPLKILAVDDEPLALKRVQLLLARVPGTELVGTSSSVPEALLAIDAHRPDVVLLDIKMAGQTGFDLVDNFSGTYVPQVIFVTAFDEFATRAFEVGAVDYVLKPVELTRFTAAIEKARKALAVQDAEERLEELRHVVAALRAQARTSEAKRYETEIWAERRNEFVRISISDLDWVEAERDYVRLHAAGQSYLLRDTISAVQGRLDPDLFIRVRRSALVRIDRVTGIRKAGYGDFRIRLASGNEVRVGRTYVKHIRSLIAPRVRSGAANDELVEPETPR